MYTHLMKVETEQRHNLFHQEPGQVFSTHTDNYNVCQYLLRAINYTDGRSYPIYKNSPHNLLSEGRTTPTVQAIRLKSGQHSIIISSKFWSSLSQDKSIETKLLHWMIHW